MLLDWIAVDAIANALMAIATFVVIYITLRSSKKERDFNQLREKIYFYSELIAGIPEGEVDVQKPEDIGFPLKFGFYTFLQGNYSIQKRYFVLAEPELKRLLQQIIPIARSTDVQSYNRAEKVLPEAICCIYRDVDILKKKYQQY